MSGATAEKRFAFGANWQRFLQRVDEGTIASAIDSLRGMLEVSTLEGKRFLDIGSGSGLFSLAARRLGASVHSFDFDPQSVACTAELRRRYFNDDPLWSVQQASVLDDVYIEQLGLFDVVYSWGVLHHTGDMWHGLENAGRCVRPGGTLFIAIYNDQGRPSRIWLRVKRAYNRLPPPFHWLVLGPAYCWLWGPTVLRDLVVHRDPFATWRTIDSGVRGMSPHVGTVDWVGGLPYEVATPHGIFDFYRKRNFSLAGLVTRQGHGCNEFVLRRVQDGAPGPGSHIESRG